jgi:hypothetical protein
MSVRDLSGPNKSFFPPISAGDLLIQQEISLNPASGIPPMCLPIRMCVYRLPAGFQIAPMPLDNSRGSVLSRPAPNRDSYGAARRVHKARQVGYS